MGSSSRAAWWLRVVAGAAVLAAAGHGRAANPNWPNRDATREEMADPANWPDDPDYGPGSDGLGGQWDMWSFVPPEFYDVGDHRVEEEAMGSGVHVDRAWQITIGDPRVVIAVLDSGIYWDNRDLVRKFYISDGELPVPEGASVHDANGDGVFNIDDYAGDPRVSDTNANGLIDPGDLIEIFSDGIDDDANGYVDDISGWDFFRNDNNPFDETGFGHGTGEARDSCAETNNAFGNAGYCPLCRPLMVRVGDSFVVDAQVFAQGVVFAVDSGTAVVQEALGSVNNYNNCSNHGAQLLLSTPGW